MTTLNFGIRAIQAAIAQSGLNHETRDRVIVPFDVARERLVVMLWAEGPTLVFQATSARFDALGAGAEDLCHMWNSFHRWPTAKTQLGRTFLRYDHYVGDEVEVNYLGRVIDRLNSGACDAQVWFAQMDVSSAEIVQLHTEIEAYLADHS